MMRNHNHNYVTTTATKLHYPGRRRMQTTTQQQRRRRNKLWNLNNNNNNNRTIIKIIYGCMIVLILPIIQIHVWLFQQHSSSLIGNNNNNNNNIIIMKKKNNTKKRRRYNYDFHNDPTRVTFDRYPEYYNNNNNKHNLSSNTTITPTTKPVTTIIVQLRGEMGNHISSIAHGRGIQLWLLQNYGIESHMLFQRQTFVNNNEKQGDEEFIISPKSLPSIQKLHNCFPKLRLWDFDNHLFVENIELQHAQQKQQQLQQQIKLTPKEIKILTYINGRKRIAKNMDPFVIQRMDMKQSLDIFQHALQLKQQQQKQQQQQSLSSHNDGGGSSNSTSSSSNTINSNNRSNNRISIPFLYSDSLDNLLLIDHYLDHYQNDLFEFDYARCCGSSELPPQEDESIFHYRNFATELKQNSKGLQETTPKQTTNILFGHLQRGSKVAITSRFNNAKLQSQVDALQQLRGLQVRIIMNNQSPMEDFCFLLQAKKELIGNFQSTFVFWAGILGGSSSKTNTTTTMTQQRKVVKLYTINSRALQNRYGGGGGSSSNLLLQTKFLYNFTNPKLQNRIQLQLIDEEKEEN